MAEASLRSGQEAGVRSARGVGSADGAAGAQGPAERTEYGASGRRQAIFALAVLALLPFVAALPMLLFHRAADGLWFDYANLLLVSAGLFAIMAMLVIELIYSVRARLSIAKTAVRFTLPAGGGPTPMLRYASHDIPYHTIKSVELRREVYGGKLTPVLLRELVIRAKDNREIRLGASLENFADPAFPYPVIASEIARRAAVQLIDQRTIWRRSRKERALGFISEFDTEAYILDPAEVDRLNVAHRRLVRGLASGLVTLIILGILADLSAIG